MSTANFAPAPFTADQHAVLSAIVKGATVTDAARCRNLHRTTVHHWARQNAHFQEALNNARSAFRASLQVAYEELAPECLDGLRDLIRDKTTPKGIRLKAYLAVLNFINQPLIETPAPVPARPPMPRPVVQPKPAPAPTPAMPSSPELTEDEIFAELSRMEQRYRAAAESLPGGGSEEFITSSRKPNPRT